ncbi:DUF732 domain-containing protein [Mycolicibacter senuensis]|uniref:DUF732 domain-containing protein n=1 Tax=Mycolicibacter senuensis TaxID=386913 RepID=A0A7I9XLC6_9MYCO|nr:DUF732 domain-containing protein [Mycolicibacter senuensis]GFG70197.1 hypothetical protein MSEN_19170 [Mycolicibacter senuensis]
MCNHTANYEPEGTKVIAVRALAGIGAAVAVVYMTLVPTAHADYDSFYKYLDDHGTMRFEFPGGLFASGIQMCQMLRGGATPDDIRRMGFGTAMDVPGVLDAAQHEICPDTLR